MKLIKLIVCLLLLFGGATNIYAQNLFENFNNSTCTENSCDCCYVNFIDNNSCLPGWAASHGTPDIFVNSNLNNLTIDGGAVYMFHDVWEEDAEGLFVEYDFKEGACYEISFSASAPEIYNVNGTLRLRAATGLVGFEDISDCNTLIPSAPSEEVIGDIAYSTFSAGAGTAHSEWGFVTVSFSPTQDFEQFWIFPEASAGMVNVVIDDLSINEHCPSQYEFFDPIVDIPSDDYHASYSITTETNGTSGFINSNPNATTTFRAGHHILLNPNTFITVNNLNMFSMEIESCVQPENCPSGNGGNNLVGSGNEIFKSEKILRQSSKETASLISNIDLFPNPSDGEFTIKMPDSFEEYGTMKINIFDYLGNSVYSKLHVGSVHIMDLRHLPKGFYIVNICSENKTFTQRLMIQ